ncbi:ATP-binding cassette domain-containing protein [Aerolutibacter ruishenii]|uniref:Atypical dual specificity phosphatase n=1 Tax=Aerolutibacter ruishenii TaxID=686800 RepID=A0A562LWH0_9GAMM|nr:ATP-binding cassette domain-containing protein [Lysobacter ruishenii]TWI11980.1 atypical dual specificity phosphatase [Lysobacter ruishenii]
MLVLQRFSVYRQGSPVVRDTTLSVESPGMLFLIGPGGAGKSSLLSAMASRDNGNITRMGTALLDGEDVGGPNARATLVPQHLQLAGAEPLADALTHFLRMRLDELPAWLQAHGLDEVIRLLDQPCAGLDRSLRRLLAVLAALHFETPLVLVDEPGAGLSEEHGERLCRRLHDLACRHMVVAATHNRQECLSLGGYTALLAGGRIQEIAPSADFFAAPATDAGRTYVATGNCNLPTDRAVIQDGIWWVVPGLLCGMSRPGLIVDAKTQYDRLAEADVRSLICLEERCEYAVTEAREYGIAHLHIPVNDMAPPSFNQAVDLCRRAEQPIRDNQAVAFHCRAGLGRTGTALALVLTWFGDEPEVAIAKVRRANPLAIQSDAQQRFVNEFADRIRGWHIPGSSEERSNVVG